MVGFGALALILLRDAPTTEAVKAESDEPGRT